MSNSDLGCLLVFLALLGAGALTVLVAVLTATRRRLKGLEGRVPELETRVAVLSRRLAALEWPASSAPNEAVVGGSTSAPTEAPSTADGPRVEAAARPPAEALAPTEQEPSRAGSSSVPDRELSPVAVPPTPVVAWSQSAAPHPESQPRSEPPAEPPAPPPPSPRPSPSKPFDWEGLIGVRLFSWIAGIALALAAIFFMRYSIDHGWLQPPIRLALGLLAGIGLLVGCELRIADRYRTTANAMDGAGIAILYSTLFAGHTLWGLIGSGLTFLLMTLVTAVAVTIAARRDSVFIAVLGLVGGFATPALLASGEDRPVSLFGYLLLVNAGLAWVAYRKRWPALAVLSLLFTTGYQWVWVERSLGASSLALAFGIFLVFPLCAALAWVLASRRRGAGGADPGERAFGLAVAVSALLPLLFAFHAATVPAYGARFGLLFGFLLLLAGGLALLAAWRGPHLLHLLGAGSVVLTFVLWLVASYTAAAWPLVLLFSSAFVLLYLLAPWVAERAGRSLGEQGRIAQLAAPLLLFPWAVLAAIEPRTEAPGVLFGSLFVLLALVAWRAIVEDRGALYYLGALAAIAAEAVWSTRHLGPESLIPALVLYGAFALFFLGVPITARRRGSRLEPRSAGAALLVAVLALLLFLAAGPVAESALWGLALLLIILNGGMFLEAAGSGRPLLAVVGSLVSWIVIAVWWGSASVADQLGPALVVLGAFALLLVAGGLWARRSATAADAGPFANGIFLGLIGHAFLAFVAVQPALALPPWPWLAVMAVVDLAIAVAALRTARGTLLIGAVGASQAVLLVWLTGAELAPWPRIAVLAALGVAAFGLGFARLAGHRLASEARSFGGAAVVGTLLGQLVVITAAEPAARPALWLVVLAHALLVLGTLRIAATQRWHWLAPVAVAPSTVAVSAWRFSADDSIATWPGDLLFAAVVCALFVGYPLVLGRPRSREALGRSFAPYLGAVLACAGFFVIARPMLIAAGFGAVLGALPLALAAALALVLRQLVGIDSGEARHSARLALVAGAALAFVTVAIPLQLDKEWVTIAWALEVAALAWLVTRVRHVGLLWWTAGLAAATTLRLVANPAVLSYHPRGGLPILNWYLYTYLVSALAFFVAAWRLRGLAEWAFARRLAAALSTAATVLLFLLVNIEIADFYSVGEHLTFHFSGGLAQDLTYTLAWALFAIGLLVAGIASDQRVVRIAAIVLLSISVFKCFLHDLGRLGGLYRVGSLVGLAVCLAAVAMLLQRFVLRRRDGAREEAG